MKLEEQQFLALLRAGLWDIPVGATLFSETTDWKGVFALAAHHTVKGIVADAVNKLPFPYQPPLPLLRELAFYLSRNRMYHARHNAVLAEINCKLMHDGVDSVLLKGQGVAINYPDSTLRHCGDIDLYIGQENFERSISRVLLWEDSGCEDMLVAKHYGFSYKGISVELHCMAEFLYLPWRNRYLQRWTKKYLQREELRQVAIDERTTVFLPPYQFDALYILGHAWHHFVFLNGIGLRQICDWVMYLHRYHREINNTLLEQDLKKLGLWQGWCLLGYIAVNYLGLPPAELPFYDESVKEEADKVMRRILTESCGQEAGLSGYIGRKKEALYRMFGRRKIICRYEGMFNTTVYYICFIAHGFYRTLKHWRAGI